MPCQCRRRDRLCCVEMVHAEALCIVCSRGYLHRWWWWFLPPRLPYRLITPAAVVKSQGVSVCFEKGDGRLKERLVIEPLSASSLECMAAGGVILHQHATYLPTLCTLWTCAYMCIHCKTDLLFHASKVCSCSILQSSSVSRVGLAVDTFDAVG